jgi:imidazoleglycerol-phosphate dehydratase
MKVASRSAEIKRVSRETEVSLELNLDHGEKIDVKTGLPFFDHLLYAMAFHGRFGLSLAGKGDLEVDAHHLVEDVGIVLGGALAAIFAKTGQVGRFGHAVIPMDEALAEVSMDVCGRPTLSYGASFPQEVVGSFNTALIREFLMGLVTEARISLHAEIRKGENSHHMAEALFKALGRALEQAYAPGDAAMSSKGRIG